MISTSMPSVKSSNPEKATSFLRWAGSKKQLLPVLKRFWNPGTHYRYIEPFAGSACLFFEIAPNKAILSDVNEQLISSLRAVSAEPILVSKHLSNLSSDSETYYWLRDSDALSATTSERAAKFIYLNRRCFNGLYRTNLAGKFNVPYGGLLGGNMPSSEALIKCSRVLKRASLVSADFEAILDSTIPGDFVYIDPPYSVRSRRTFKEYDASQFGVKSLFRLRRCLVEMATREVSFVLSYADCPEAKFLSEGFETRVVHVRRSIAGFAKHRQKSGELIAFNKGEQ